MGSCEIRFSQKQDYHVLNPLPFLFLDQLAETKVLSTYVQPDKKTCANISHEFYEFHEGSQQNLAFVR
jgi:hypothetical protein